MIHVRRFLMLVLLSLLALPLSAQDKTPYEIALERIEEARISGATGLDLSVMGLTKLPPEIGQLGNLKRLNLYANLLTTLPPEIGQLANLQTLSLDVNRFSAVPLEIGQLANLRELSISYNQLSTIPPEIGQLVNLQKLYLYNTQLSVVPPEIGQLVNLQTLALYNTQLSALPPEIGQLEQLCRFDLGDNRLRELPTEIGNLTHLTDARCGLSLIGNPLISPPPEIVSQGTAAVLDYLRNQAAYHTRQLVLSGAGGVGILAGVLLLARWRYRTLRKPKKKNESIA